MKNWLLLLLLALAFIPQNVNAEQLSASCENPEGGISIRRCVLNYINSSNRLNPDIKPWIGLQIGIPAPKMLCDAEEFLCYKSKLVGVKDASGMVVGFFQFSITMIAITLSVVMVIGGAMYITSGGDAGRASKGKDFIKNASMSLVVLMFSVMMLYQINPKLVKVNLDKITTIDKEEAQISCSDSDGFACGIEYDSPYTTTTGGAKCVGTKPSDPKTKYCIDCKESGKDAAYCTEQAKKKITKEEIAKKANDTACKDNAECTSGICMNNKCSSLPASFGQTCSADVDCKGLQCETNGTSTCVLGRTGADCDPGDIVSTIYECGDGYDCFDGSGYMNFCVGKTGQTFQLCSSDKHCGSGMECVGVCVPKGKTGSCSKNEDCFGALKTTTPAIAPKCIRNLCSSTLNDSWCATDADCLSKHCIVQGTVGVCSPGINGDSCMDGADCNSTKCILKAGSSTGVCSN